MVKVFFTVYGSTWESLSTHDILSHQVTNVGLFYSFYVSKVQDPESIKGKYSTTKWYIQCKHCKWYVLFSRSSGGRTGGAKVRDPAQYGPWRLSGIPPKHVDCTSDEILDVNKTLYILHHQPFVDALWENPSLTRSQAKPLWKSPFSISKLQYSTFSRAKHAVFIAQAKERLASYNNLAAFLNHLSILNDQMTVALQLDNFNRFYRLFIGFPQSYMFHGVISYSFIQTDGFHFKGTFYDGVCIIYCTKNGFGKNVILAFAIVPRENIEHQSWAIQMLWRCHPSLTLPQILFTDRGPLLNAVKLINDSLGITVPVNYCDRHFIRNIVSNFNIKKKHRKVISNGVRMCAASQNLDQFCSSIHSFTDNLLAFEDNTIKNIHLLKS